MTWQLVRQLSADSATVADRWGSGVPFPVKSDIAKLAPQWLLSGPIIEEMGRSDRKPFKEDRREPFQAASPRLFSATRGEEYREEPSWHISASSARSTATSS